jgi:hypothetical protein
MASTRQESTELVGISFNVPPARARTSSIRINWRKFSSSARSVLCIRTRVRAQQDDNDWTRDSKDVLHLRSKSDVARPSSSRDSSVAPQTRKPRKLQRAHTEIVGGNTLVQEVAKTLAIRPTEHTPRSETAASLNLNVPSIKERGAQYRRGDVSPLCDLDHASPFHFEETAAGHQVAPTGDTIEAMIDAMFQLEDEDGSCASTPGPLTPCTDGADSEKTEQNGEGRVQMVVLEEREKRISAGPRWDEEDARRAWEAMKRRVMYIEEHGALPDDSEHDAPTWNYRDAVERALRESRARWRKGWAEEAMRRSQAGQQLGQGREAREEDEKDANPKRDESEDEEMGDLTTTMTKKGRRHAGCWIRENDGVFVRLVSSDLSQCRKTYNSSHGSSVY